jgi:hypothetical protein
MRIPLLDKANEISASLTGKRNDYSYLSFGDQAIGLAMHDRMRQLEQRIHTLESSQTRHDQE